MSFLVLITACAENQQFEGQQMGEGELEPFSTISSMTTDVPSDQYPPTKPIQVQQAKYDFYIIDQQGQVQFRQGSGLDLNHLVPGQWGFLDDIMPQQGQQPPAQEVPQQETPEPQPPRQEEADQQQEQAPQQPEQEQQPAQGMKEAEQRVIALTNAERLQNGLPELQSHNELSNVARKKSDDMQQNNYFSHTSPTYGSPFDMIRNDGISFSSAGENIAQGQTTPEQAVQAWLNSSGHRENIMSQAFTHIGIGYNENGHYWTQMFISQ